ncbi:MAG: CHASE domain-containing protein [Patescibacteria group bacterium]
MSGKNRRFVTFGALVAPLVIVVLATILSLEVGDRFRTELASRFEADAETSLRSATDGLDGYSDLLYAGRAMSLSSEKVTTSEWRTFYNQQSLFDRYPGVSSIAYVESVPTAELTAFEQQMKSPDYFGPSFRLDEMSQRPQHSLVSSYISQNDLTAIVGMDLTRLDDRNAVYESAAAKGAVVASPPFKLATGYEGFFSVLAVYRNDTLDGFVLSSFRFDTLMKRLFSDESFGYRVTDVTTTKPTQLYASSGFDTTGYLLERKFDVGGRAWKVEITRDIDTRAVGFLLPAAIMTTALILAATMYLYSIRASGRRAP